MEEEILPDLINERPTVLMGLTAAEFWLVAKYCMSLPVCISRILIVVRSWSLWSLMILSISAAIGLLISIAVIKLWVAEYKSDKPFGYLARRAKLNSWLFKLGITKDETEHRTGMWRHFK